MGKYSMLVFPDAADASDASGEPRVGSTSTWTWTEMLIRFVTQNYVYIH
jgi:hypothetical protein